MPKRSSKAGDINQIAATIVEAATIENSDKETVEGKDPAAVALGRKGGLKGGKARAAKLTPEERSAAAKKAAQARWNKQD